MQESHPSWQFEILHFEIRAGDKATVYQVDEVYYFYRPNFSINPQ